MNLQDRIEQVDKRIQEACLRSGRKRDEVNVIAVTKYVSLGTTENVLKHGLIHIGENRWQDAKEKWEHLGHEGIWHFIGHLQSNKVRDVLGKFHYVHSLDRLSLAKELDKRAQTLNIQVPCFLQVNVSGESSKFGVDPESLENFAKKISDFSHLQIIGLMTMAPHEEDPEKTRPVFRGLRQLLEQLNQKKILKQPLTELSMGMSNDFEIAIEEGATWIRLGSVLVGKEI